MHLLLFNLMMDADHPVLGFATRWVDAIAERVDRVTVITMVAGRIEPRTNVRVLSVGKERGWSEPRRAVEFYRHCGRLIRSDRPDACFSHMIPLFSILFAPLAKAFRIPSLLWYAHGATPREALIAERLVDRCVTSTPEGFRLDSRKLFVLQQGIDTERLRPPQSPASNWSRTVVSVGRISPVKQLKESLEAIAETRAAGAPLRLEVFGAPATEADRSYEREARALAVRLGLDGKAVTFHGPVVHARIGDAFQSGGMFLNLGRSGSLDKAILEAMSCGCIPICDNDAFVAIARQRGWDSLVPGGRRNTAATLTRVFSMQSHEQAELRKELRDFVVREHSLERLADRILAHLDELVQQSRRSRKGQRRV